MTKQREHATTGDYHCVFAAHNHDMMFADTEVKPRLLESLRLATEKYDVALLGDVVMTNHVHCVLEGGLGSDWTDNSHQGSTYAFWKSKNLLFKSDASFGSEQQRLLYSMNCNRAGTLLTGSYSMTFGCAWVRSVTPYFFNGVVIFNSYGNISDNASMYPSFSFCVSPSFAM